MTNTANISTNELQFIPITEEVMQANKKEFITLLNSTGRTGVKKLIAHLDKNGFFEAPASAADSLACKGGLVQHSLNVARCAVEQNKAWGKQCDELKVLFVALLHDVWKIGQFGKPYFIERVLSTSGKQSDSKPYVENADLAGMEPGARSVVIVSQFVQLDEEEQYAIEYAHGINSNGKKTGDGKAAMLQSIMYVSDFASTTFFEEKNAVAVA